MVGVLSPRLTPCACGAASWNTRGGATHGRTSALPSRRVRGGWVVADKGGWTCCVEQGQYGHYARKPTLLYAVATDLPELRWGKTEARLDPEVVARMGLKRAQRLGEVGARGGGKNSTPRIHTPDEFRDLLVRIACTANQCYAEKIRDKAEKREVGAR